MYIPSKLKISVNMQTICRRIQNFFKLYRLRRITQFELFVEQIELCKEKGNKMKSIE